MAFKQATTAHYSQHIYNQQIIYLPVYDISYLHALPGKVLWMPGKVFSAEKFQIEVFSLALTLQKSSLQLRFARIDCV